MEILHTQVISPHLSKNKSVSPLSSNAGWLRAWVNPSPSLVKLYVRLSFFHSKREKKKSWICVQQNIMSWNKVSTSAVLTTESLPFQLSDKNAKSISAPFEIDRRPENETAKAHIEQIKPYYLKTNLFVQFQCRSIVSMNMHIYHFNTCKWMIGLEGEFSHYLHQLRCFWRKYACNFTTWSGWFNNKIQHIASNAFSTGWFGYT